MLNSQSTTTRRTFLGTTASLAIAATGGAPLFLPKQSLGQVGPNDQIRVGAIGVGGRASLLLQQLPESAKIVALRPSSR